MPLARVYTASLLGVDARVVSVEVDISHGLPGWHMVGLPEQVVKESKDRVQAALRNSGYAVLQQKITVNFAPADYKKRGTGFDLPIAIGLLAASGFLERERVSRYMFVAELSLTGSLLPVNGVLAMSVAAKAKGLDGIVLPRLNAREARLVRGIDVVGCDLLSEAVIFMREGIRPEFSDPPVCKKVSERRYDLADVKGQIVAKRALEIAAAGNHNILMFGPPGTGKTMLAERIPSILPPLTEEESLETTKIYSALGMLDFGSPLMTERPFRSPHHSSSAAGLFGGGSGSPSIGEISLAHNGVLFLDELPEFRRDVIEMLRQPLEHGYVHITRAGYSVKYPARFLMGAAMNPCRCGYLGHPVRACSCSVAEIQAYRKRISGPILDRIDLRIEVPALSPDELMEAKPSIDSDTVRRKVVAARKRQGARYKKTSIYTNAELTPRMIREFCPLDAESKRLIMLNAETRGYSARAIDRIIRIARTIADLEGEEKIGLPHVAEAIQHHRLDKLEEF